MTDDTRLMDDMIAEYHHCEKLTGQRMLTMHDKHPVEVDQSVDDRMMELWRTGINRWGKAFSEREYQIRESKKPDYQALIKSIIPEEERYVRDIYSRNPDMVFDLYVCGRSAFCIDHGMTHKFSYYEIVTEILSLLMHEYAIARNCEDGDLSEEERFKVGYIFNGLLKDDSLQTTRNLNSIKDR